MKDRWGQEFKVGSVICYTMTYSVRKYVKDYVITAVREKTLTGERAFWWRDTDPAPTTISETIARPHRATVLPHITAEQVLNPPKGTRYE